MPTISAEEQQKAIDFTTAITELLEFVEKVVPHISEGEYLKQMDNCLVVNNNRTIVQQIQYLNGRVRDNALVQQHQRELDMPITQKRKVLTKGEKLASGKWCLCDRCDRLITKSYYGEHRNTELCKQIIITKKLTHSFKRTNTEREALLIAKIQNVGAKSYRRWLYE